MRTHEFYVADPVWIVSTTGSLDDVFLHLVPQSADALWVCAAKENLAPKTNLVGLFAAKESAGEVSILRSSRRKLKFKAPTPSLRSDASTPSVLHARHMCF